MVGVNHCHLRGRCKEVSERLEAELGLAQAEVEQVRSRLDAAGDLAASEARRAKEAQDSEMLARCSKKYTHTQREREIFWCKNQKKSEKTNWQKQKKLPSKTEKKKKKEIIERYDRGKHATLV